MGDEKRVTRATDASRAKAPRAPSGAAAGACVLLAGGIRPSALSKETGSSVLNLWLSDAGSVLEHWLERVAHAASPGARVHVVHDPASPAPAQPRRTSGMSVSIHPEPRAYRGPAGILRDVCEGLAPETIVLAGEAGRWLSGDPAGLVRAHASRGAEATVGVNPDGSPAGLYAISAEALGRVPGRGFMDIKEQWLQRLVEAKGRVWTHRMEGDGALPLRTREQFLEAARRASGGADPREGRGLWDGVGSPASWRVIGPGTIVGDGATVLESVVMPGAEVGAGAVIVRSLLCPGARVEAGEVVSATIRTGRGV